MTISPTVPFRSIVDALSQTYDRALIQQGINVYLSERRPREAKQMQAGVAAWCEGQVNPPAPIQTILLPVRTPNRERQEREARARKALQARAQAICGRHASHILTAEEVKEYADEAERWVRLGGEWGYERRSNL